VVVSSGHRSESLDSTKVETSWWTQQLFIHSTFYIVFRISWYKVLSDRMFGQWLIKMDLKGKGHELIGAPLWNFTRQTK
jgi:hypothetical protein